MRENLNYTTLVPRPVCAIRVTRGGLEPSAIARGRPRRIFATSLTGDVTSEIAEDGWELGGIYIIYRYFNCFKHFPIIDKGNKNTY